MKKAYNNSVTVRRRNFLRKKYRRTPKCLYILYIGPRQVSMAYANRARWVNTYQLRYVQTNKIIGKGDEKNRLE